MTIHEPAAISDENSPTKETTYSACGCKGIRYCRLCVNSERCTTSESNELPFYSPLIATNVNPKSSVEEIAQACCSTNVGMDLVESITGLTLITNFLTESEEQFLLERIDERPWIASQSGRRKQDYGPRVNFKQHKVKMDGFVGMPDYVDLILQKMEKTNNSVLSNFPACELCNLEYAKWRESSIDFHKDDAWIWGNRLISINLVNDSVITLEDENSKRLVFVYMPRRSLLCMADETRHTYKHGIFPQHIVGRRLAMTLREPSSHFMTGGELYEKYGKELIRLGNLRVDN
ncbi:DNA N6-methyl adenine demethylase [Ditylenchus destructor]|uniref:DNA N6-methyl adenine demethylase n=1 Tax=Ditylenchus destructor TaxID=166010 RepID=A0AAD4NH92_9BILA|nr:DNA N6-methyl adenine demethylase [Ditylenchus destructor]